MVSVVLPTYKRNKLLFRCLESLLEQDISDYLYEIIVIDDASSDETYYMMPSIGKFRRHVHVSYYRTNHQGPAAARNLGWKRAQGEIIAFTDDDCIVTRNWVRKGSNLLKKSLADALGGKVKVPINPIPTDYERCISWLEKEKFITANCFLWKQTLQKINGFDERFTSAWREDSDIYFRMKISGMTINYSKEVVVIHPVRQAPWGISLREQKKTMFNALLFKKFPKEYKQHVEQMRPHFYYFTISMAFLALAGFFLSEFFIFYTGLIIWGFCVICFTSIRLKNTSHKPNHILEMFITSVFIPFISVFWRLVGSIKFKTLYF